MGGWWKVTQDQRKSLVELEAIPSDHHQVSSHPPPPGDLPYTKGSQDGHTVTQLPSPFLFPASSPGSPRWGPLPLVLPPAPLPTAVGSTLQLLTL